MAQTKRTTAPRAARKAQPTAAQAKRTIRTQRSLGRRLLLHPTSVFALLLLGVFLAGLTYRVAASDYTVSAAVTAQPLQIGANITDPQDNQTVSSRPIMVSGNCPNDAYVKLMRNGNFSGVAICNNGSFQIQTDLYAGVNELQAQDYNITDQAGPLTSIIHVVYKVPATAAAAAATTGSGADGSDATVAPESSDTALPLLLSSDYHFNVFTTAQQFQWTMQYHTGTAPYDTHIDWGDNQKSHMSVATAAAFTISHRYTDGGYYPIIVTGTDAKHQTISVQLAAYIKKPGDPATNGNILPTASGSAGSGTSAGAAGSGMGASNLRWLLYTWPAYAIVIVMIVSFWLGERREFLTLARSTQSDRRLRHL